jgi:hypothetical protein
VKGTGVIALELYAVALSVLLVVTVWRAWQPTATAEQRRFRGFGLVLAVLWTALMVDGYAHLLIRRQMLAGLVAEQVQRLEVNGRVLQPDQVAAVVRSLRETEWVIPPRHDSRPTVRLVVTLNDGRVMHFRVLHDKPWNGAVIKFVHPSWHGYTEFGVAFSSGLEPALASAGVSIP